MSLRDVSNAGRPQWRRSAVHFLKSILLAYSAVFIIIPVITTIVNLGPLDYPGTGSTVGVGLPFNYVYHTASAIRIIRIQNVVVPWALVVDFLFWLAVALLFFRYRPTMASDTANLFLIVFILYLAFYYALLRENGALFVPPWLIFFY
ncbi:MAG: hypothetical protein JRN37_09495 [Nitrososphaerota archaeon]|nr:hypothetical protein [Nitrososphaerota archaeon]MDG7039363.1 hypothetical protein [Nitrososphaerota archaeon]